MERHHGSRTAPLLSQGQRDAALQAVLEDLAPGGRADLSSDTALLPADGDIVTAWRRLPAAAAQFADFPDGIDARLQAALDAGGITRPYTHQADAMRHVLAGRHVVTMSPTASGKTLCYNAPSLARFFGTTLRARCICSRPRHSRRTSWLNCSR